MPKSFVSMVSTPKKLFRAAPPFLPIPVKLFLGVAAGGLAPVKLLQPEGPTKAGLVPVKLLWSSASEARREGECCEAGE